MTFAPGYIPELFDLIFRNIPLGWLAYASGLTPGLYLIIVIGPVSALSGILVSIVNINLKEWLSYFHIPLLIGNEATEARVGIILLFILIVELVPLSLWLNNRYPDDYLGDRKGRNELIENINGNDHDETTRILDADSDLNDYFLMSMLTGHPGLLGYQPDAPPAADTLARKLLGLIHQDSTFDQLSPEAADLLYQLNVSFVITDGDVKHFAGLTESSRSQDAVLWRVASQAPVMAVLSSQTPVQNSTIQTTSTIPVKVIEHIATATTVKISFSIPQRAVVQVSYTAYPYQRVSLDGKHIPVTATDLGLIGFWADAGEHTVVITPELSPLRQWSLVISAISTLCALGIMLFPRRVKQRW